MTAGASGDRGPFLRRRDVTLPALSFPVSMHFYFVLLVLVRERLPWQRASFTPRAVGVCVCVCVDLSCAGAQLVS